jgi:pimeloyl-ACP methyl ester carboxylesterase
MKTSKNLLLGLLGIFLLFTFFIFTGCSKQQTKKDILPELQYFEAPNAKIAFRTYGQGDPLLMCMGYSGNMDMWDTSLIDLLKQKYKLTVFDYRGMGYSTNTDTSFTINTLAEDVNGLCDFLKLKKTNIMGWSMGGYVAQSFAINHPEKINKLILYATDLGDTIAIPPDQKILELLADTLSTPSQIMGTLFTPKWVETHPNLEKYFSNAKEPLNYKTIKLQDAASSVWLSPGGGSAGHLHKLKMPTLIISGDMDVVVPYKNSEMLSDSITSSTLIKVNNGGHGLMFQYPKTVGRYILAFLEQGDGKR